MSGNYNPPPHTPHKLPHSVITSPAENLRTLLSLNKRLIVPVVYDGLTARLVKLMGFEVNKKERLLVAGSSTDCVTTVGVSVWCAIMCARGKGPMSAVNFGPCHLYSDSRCLTFIDCAGLLDWWWCYVERGAVLGHTLSTTSML